MIYSALSNISSSFSLHTTRIAPCAGAGIIQSSSMAFARRNPMRCRPAAAKMAPHQLLASSFFNLVFTLPRMGSI